MPVPLNLQEVAQHKSKDSCWVIIKNSVYDVTEFLPEHPGGAAIILKYAGRDATKAYEPIHPSDALAKNLPPSKHLGPLDSSSSERVEKEQKAKAEKKTQDELRVEKAMKERPPLSRILSVREMEDVARRVLSYKAWSYYSSAAEDEITHEENIRAFSRLFFHPRILRPLSSCSPHTTILGYPSSLPLFVSGAALAKLGHPDGEANITRACGRLGLIQMVSSNASLSYSEIAQAKVKEDQVLFFQLYKHKEDKKAVERVREVERLGYNAIFLTVDAIVPGFRERDIKAPFVLEEQEREAERKAGKDVPIMDAPQDEEGGGLGTAGALISDTDRDLSWERTIPWLKKTTKLPIVIKGIQCVEDAVLAAEAGVDGIMITNHGGRQLDFALPSIDVLYRLQKQCPYIFSKLEVYMDGGVRKGSDIVKAVCLGAKAVGMGRPFLYAQSAYGDKGVERLIKILEEEVVRCMRLLGAATIADLVPEMVEQVSWQPLKSKL